MNTATLLSCLLAAFLIAASVTTATAGVVQPLTNVEVTDAGLGGELVTHPRAVARDGTTYAVWRDARRTGTGTLEADIFFASSTDGGATWSQNRQVTDPDFVGWTDSPTVDVAPDGSIWVAWGLRKCNTLDLDCGGVFRENDVRVAVSRDGGVSWTESSIWDGIPGDNDNQTPELHADNDRIMALVHEPFYDGDVIIGFDVYLVTRILSPVSVNVVRLTTDTGLGRASNERGGPRLTLAVNGNTVCAAWEDTRDRFSIYGSCSANRGQSFPAAARWSSNGDDFLPRLAFAPNGALYLSYKDVDKKDIVVRSSSDAGATWSAPRHATAVGNDYTYDYDMTVAPDSQVVVAASVGGTSLSSIGDLFAFTSIDGGQTFGVTGPLERGNQADLGSTAQYNVSIATDGPAGNARAVFVWTDDRLDRSGVWSASTALDAIPPTVPGNLRASNGVASVLLQWDAASDPNGVAYYDVLRSAAPGGPYTRVNALGVTQTYFRDVGLPADTYYYRVVAVDATSNVSAPSNEASGAATTGAAPNINGTLAYITAGGVGIRPLSAGVAGAQTALLPGSSPAYSVDGSTLHFVRESAGQWHIMRGTVNGGGAVSELSGNRLLADLDVPADTNLVASVENTFFNGVCTPMDPLLMTLNPKARVASRGNVVADAIAVSPDGRWLAYTHRIYCDAVGTVLLTSNHVCLLDTLAGPAATPVCQDAAHLLGVDFGNSGNVIVFSADYSGQNEIWRATVTQAGQLVNLNQLTRGPAGQPSSYPRMSSDGSWVIFSRDVDAGPGENLQAHVVRLDGDGIHALGFAAQRPVWAGGGPAAPVITGSARAYLPLVAK